jgi:pimeloyl-ACP methyl ester carboxylesterase
MNANALSPLRGPFSVKPWMLVAGVTLASTALAAHLAARRTERMNPPKGRFVEVDGVRLHWLERGDGPPLVLLHGNGAMMQDFLASPLVSAAAREYRVILFDRPGYGYSSRPRLRSFSPEAQADLLVKALGRIGVERPIVLGHSWGALVAAAMALRHPDQIRSVVLVSGYFFPTIRADVPGLSVPAIPILGDIVRYTVAPLLARLTWPLMMRRLFGPREVPAAFRRVFSKEMAMRPSQLRAAAAESASMIPAARRLSANYDRIKIPVAIVAGRDDRQVMTADQSGRLAEEIKDSRSNIVADVGHMIHHGEPAAVLAAIDLAR